MAAPNYTLPVSGSAEKYATVTAHNAAINAALQSLHYAAMSGDSDLEQAIKTARGELVGLIASGEKALAKDISDAIDRFAEQIKGTVTSLHPIGQWNPAEGAFPPGAETGTFYIVSEDGVVAGEEFSAGDWLIPLKNWPSRTEFAGEWTRGDYSPVPHYRFKTRGEAESPSGRTGIERFIAVGALVYEYDAEGTALTTGDGRTWKPSGAATLRHFGAVGNGIADDTAALQAALMSGLPLHDEGGIYRQVGGITARHPLTFVGGGQGKTVFRYEQMGGYNGEHGITLQIDTPATIGDDAATASKTKMSDFTVRISGENGASWFKAPRAQDDLWRNVKPAYEFSGIYHTGDNAGDEGFFELATTAWECCIDLAEGNLHSIKNCAVGGNYDYRLPPDGDATRSGYIRLSAPASGPGGVLCPEISHIWVQHIGRAIEIGGRVVRGQFHGIAIHAGWEGMISDVERSGSAYGLEEHEMAACNINVSKTAFRARGLGSLTLQNVDLTRPSDGYNHGTEWVGADLINISKVTIQGGRARNNAPEGQYSGQQVGYRLNRVLNLMAGGMNIRCEGEGQMNIGVQIIDPGRGLISGLVARGSVVHLIEFSGTPVFGGYPDSGYTLVGIPTAPSVITGQRIRYAGDVTRATVHDVDEPFRTQDSATEVTGPVYAAHVPANSPKWRRFNMLAGNGNPYTYDYNMLPQGARGGDLVEMTIRFVAANPTFRVIDAAGNVLLTLNGPAGAIYFVSGRYLSTNTAQFRITNAVRSLHDQA